MIMGHGFLALLHAVLLIASAFFALRHFPVSRSHKILAGFLLLWFNLVITGYGLSLFTKLNDLTLYFTLSCILAVITGLAVDALLRRGPAAAYSPPAIARNDAPWDFTPLMKFSLAALAVAVAGSALIAFFYYSNNPDSVAYRFGRVFLYLGKGNLMHPAHNDPRISFYPLNGALAYVYFAMYQLDGLWFNLLSYLSWVISALGTYVLARDIGASRNGSFLAGCMYALSPIVLVLATSTNDEVIAATPVLISLIFFHRWWYSGRLFDAVLGGIGFGLGAGTKLHIAFFWPVMAAAVLIALLSLYRSGDLGKFIRERSGHIIAAGLLAALLVCPFMVINTVESKHPILPPEFSSQVLNKPFNAKVAMINMTLFSAQLFLSPIPELAVSPDTGFKARVYERFNAFFNKHLFFWVDKNDHYSSEPYYYFRGVADPIGWFAIEEMEWLGFVPFLMLVGAIYLWRYRDTKKGTLALWLLAGFFVWHLYKSATTKYVEAAATYYSYPFTICAAGLAILWDKRQDMKKFSSSTVKYLFIAVIVTNALFAVNILACNVRRNLTSLTLSLWTRERIERAPLPSAIKNSLLLAGNLHFKTPLSPSVVTTLRAAPRIHLFYTRWEFPMFRFMYINPGARYTSSGELTTEKDVLNILLYAARS
jgi:4-amino-4-deoxy-L-arabinose transferase-like glycosyltransferase